MKKFALLLCLFALLSCNSQDDGNPLSQPAAPPTPTFLDSDAKEYDLGSDWSLFRKGGRRNLVDKLYKEAVKKDKQLQGLEKQLNDWPELRQTKTELYDDYVNKSQWFWSSSQEYYDQLQDSLLRQQVRQKFEGLSTDYLSSITDHQSLLQQIDEKELQLNDQYILLKLELAHQLFRAYQTNEFPQLESLQQLQTDLDSLILRTKAATQEARATSPQ